jgi:hypothetical protein
MASPSVSIPIPTAPTASGGTPKPTPAQLRKPNFDSTRILHHGDGSHTVFHESSDPGQNVSYAKADLNGVHDGLDQHLGTDSE